jgi:hypothetical protein
MQQNFAAEHTHRVNTSLHACSVSWKHVLACTSRLSAIALPLLLRLRLLPDCKLSHTATVDLLPVLLQTAAIVV